MEEKAMPPCEEPDATYGTKESGVFVVAVEFKDQGPVVMECEAVGTSYLAAIERLEKLARSANVIRVGVYQLESTSWRANPLLLADMKRLQK